MKYLLIICLFIYGHVFALETGNVIGRNIYGLATDFQGDPLMVGQRPLIYPYSDFTYRHENADKKYNVSVFSDTVASIYITNLNQETDIPLDTYSVPLGDLGGLSLPVDYIVTPWQSILLSEQPKINTSKDTEFSSEFMSFYKNQEEQVNAYNYGYIGEIILPSESARAKLIKNYAIGRVNASSLLLMPDKQTLYVHDNLSGNLYVFIAEVPESLAKGVLLVYNAKQNQFVELGDSSALKVKFALRRVAFDRLFDNESCSEEHTEIESIYGKECLKIQKRSSNIVGLLEPVRVSRILGVQGLDKSISAIEFDSQSNILHLLNNDKKIISFRVASSNEYSSNYLIRGTL